MSKSYILRKIEKFLLLVLLLYSIFIGILTGFMYVSLKKLTGIKKLEVYQPLIPSKIYDVKNRLVAEYFEEQREIIPIDEIPPILIKTLISVEDKDFYNHKGISFSGILRAFIVNIVSGRIKEGGSTITQQLAKLLFTTRKRDILRKIKEIWLALQIEKLYTKEEILEFYLNQVYLGHGAYGVESASKFYFNKSVRDLNIAECALIAGLSAAPNRFSPIKNPENAMKRHKKVLQNMVDDNIISSKDAKKYFYEFWTYYQNKIVSPNVSFWKTRIDYAPHFTEYIRRIIQERLSPDLIYKEGLRIYSTIDLDVQKAAQNVLWKRLEEINGNYFIKIENIEDYFDRNFTDILSILGLYFNNKKILNVFSQKDIKRFNYYISKNLTDPIDIVSLLFSLDNVHKFFRIYREKTSENLAIGEKVEGALIAIEPSTGYIKAMVGGRGFTPENQFNRAVQSYRQPGSSFKPFVYIAALDTCEITPSTIFTDSPVVYIDKEGNEWIPNNYSGEYYGIVTARKALQKSINIISVKIADKIGITTIRELAAKMLHIYNYSELQKNIPDDLSLALGTASVSPLQMANAFAIIANNGIDVVPISIRYITDRNGFLIVDYEKKIRETPKAQIITPQVAFLISEMMKSVLRPGGTAWSAVCQTGFPYTSAWGKTGTSDNWRDAWFVGTVGDLTACVWVGFDNYSRSLGAGEEGGRLAAPIWCEFMLNALRNKYVPEKINVPSGITNLEVCALSGKLPSPYCKEKITEYFIKGTQPKEVCSLCKEGYKQYELDEKKIEAIIEKQREEQRQKLLKKFKLEY